MASSDSRPKSSLVHTFPLGFHRNVRHVESSDTTIIMEPPQSEPSSTTELILSLDEEEHTHLSRLQQTPFSPRTPLSANSNFSRFGHWSTTTNTNQLFVHRNDNTKQHNVERRENLETSNQTNQVIQSSRKHNSTSGNIIPHAPLVQKEKTGIMSRISGKGRTNSSTDVGATGGHSPTECKPPGNRTTNSRESVGSILESIHFLDDSVELDTSKLEQILNRSPLPLPTFESMDEEATRLGGESDHGEKLEREGKIKQEDRTESPEQHSDSRVRRLWSKLMRKRNKPGRTESQ